MKNRRIFITGGAGYLGSNLVKKYYDDNEVTIYSRDEAKHYYLKKQFPKVNCIIGDIRNLDLMLEASKDHGIGIFAASLKQIEAVDQNVEEAVEIIVNGALNSRRCAEKNGFEAACFISSDKSRAATTLYGSMKFVAGESFIVNDDRYAVRLSSAIYGNVLNSTGSVIPLIWNSIRSNYELALYSAEMTRFSISIDDAIDLVQAALKTSGYNVIPKLKSFRIRDLFEIYRKRFGLRYYVGKPRISEKIHEQMISKEEVSRVTTDENSKYYYMHYKNVYGTTSFINDEFSSKDYVMSEEELDAMLSQYNYFKSS